MLLLKTIQNRFSRTISLLILFLTLLLSITGCGGSSSTDSNEMVLYTVLTAKMSGFDPADIGDQPTARVAGQFFECLYQYHYLLRPYKVVPMLADGMPQISADGTTYSVKIKKGVYFADDPCFKNGKGRELKAQDFVFAWKRIADIKTLSKMWWIFENKVAGLDEFRAYTKTCKNRLDVDYSRPVEGLYAPDDYTLVLKLKKPWPQIIYIFAFCPVTAPMAKEAVDYYGKDIVSHPVGTGPYVLKEWNRGSYIDMVKNPNYRKDFYPAEGEKEDYAVHLLDDAGKPLPFADRIVWTLIEEDQPMWLQFLRGKLDATGIPKDNFGQVVTASRGLTDEMKRLNVKLETFRDPSTFWIGFNMEDPLLGKNKPLRQALSYAIDRAKYIDLFWNGRDDIAYGFIPPLMDSYNPEIKKTGAVYDPEKAKEFVKKAEQLYGGKIPTLTLSTGGTDTLARQICQFYQRCFKDVGIDVEIEQMDWPTFLGKVHNKSVQMFTLGWVADYPDAENFLQLFYSKNVSPGPNNFNYVNPEFDKIYERVAVMQDSPERTELYRKAELMVIEDCPAVFTNHRVDYILRHDWLLNYKPNVFQYGLSRYYKVDKNSRREYKELLRKIK